MSVLLFGWAKDNDVMLKDTSGRNVSTNDKISYHSYASSLHAVPEYRSLLFIFN